MVSRASLVRLLLISPAVMLLAVVLFVPTGRLLALSLGEGALTLRHYHQMLTDPLLVRSFLTSLWLSVATTLLTILLGYPLAYLLAVQAGPLAKPLFLFVLLPFWTSITVRTFAFLILLGRQGPLNHGLDRFDLLKADFVRICHGRYHGVGPAPGQAGPLAQTISPELVARSAWARGASAPP